MGRTPIRATAVREVADEKPKHGKTRLRKRASQRSLLDIDAAIIEKLRVEYGCDVQWVTTAVHGKPEYAIRQSYEVNGWEPIMPDMFDGAFDGMYTLKGHKGEIEYGGLVLMYRPMELTEEARQEDAETRLNAMESVKKMMTDGEIPGIGGGFTRNHPTARANTTFRQEVRPPMDIPTD